MEKSNLNNGDLMVIPCHTIIIHGDTVRYGDTMGIDDDIIP